MQQPCPLLIRMQISPHGVQSPQVQLHQHSFLLIRLAENVAAGFPLLLVFDVLSEGLSLLLPEEAGKPFLPVE